MSRYGAALALVAGLLGLAGSTASADPARGGAAAPQIRAEDLRAGRDINLTINDAGQIQEALRAVLAEGELTDAERAKLEAEIERLSAEIGVRKPAVAGFLRTLGEREVPLEQLPAKLAEIAERHRALLERLAILAEEQEPEGATLLKQARADIEAGDNDAGDRLLRELEELELEAAEAGMARAAAARAERGDLALTRLDYRTAAEHFGTAAQREPDPEQRLAYMDREADALYRQGEEFGDNTALAEAIGLYRQLLSERTRARVPLDWAGTQNNLGNALLRLGERESGTARLEEAVAAYRAALEEYTRARVPLDWAMTQNNLRLALWRLGERESGTARLEEPHACIEVAWEVYRRAGMDQYDSDFASRLEAIRGLIEARQKGG